MSGLHTGVDAPKCHRLKSAMQRATDAYDRRVLRRLALNGPERIAARPKAAPAARPRSARERAGDESRERQPATAVRPAAQPPAQVVRKGDDKGDDEWLRKGLHLAKQVDGHTTFTHTLRRQSHVLSANTEQRAKDLRVGTNAELRVRLKDVDKARRKIDAAVQEVAEEHRAFGHIKHFIIEIRNIVEVSALAGCRMRQGLRQSRPAGERPKDAVDDLLAEEASHCVLMTDEITAIIDSTDEQLALMAQVIDELYADMEAKAETMRVYEQLLSLDGSSSMNLRLGGTAAEQPPLDILLDPKAKQILQDGKVAAEEEKKSRAATGVLLDRGYRLLTHALTMRKQVKRRLMGLDEEGRRVNKKVEQALKSKVTLQRKLIDTLTQRLHAAVQEREELEAQADTSRTSLNGKTQEKDVVCKRLHLRRQVPPEAIAPHQDKVTLALEKEFHMITTAVHDCTAKIAQLMLEIARMQESEAALRDALGDKEVSLKLDEQCLAIPFIHKYPVAMRLYNGICSGYSSIYGCTQPLTTAKLPKEAAGPPFANADAPDNVRRRL